MTGPVAVAMSGGVDSSVAACLLKKKGFNLIGVFMKLHDHGYYTSGCCSLEDSNDARKVADELDIPFYVIGLQDIFKSRVTDYFIKTYMEGMTPNPCINCNRDVKFGGLRDRLSFSGVDKIATGHYAKIEESPDGKGFLLKRGTDISKDQSYFLFNLKQEQLAKILFPLGDLTKAEVRDIAREERLPVKEKKESQDICFMREGSYFGIFKDEMVKVKKGYVLDISGNILGNHDGCYRFTIGQRKRLGVSVGYPLYVLKINAERNEIVVGPEEHLMKKSLSLSNVSWILNRHQAPFKADVKIRYAHRGEIAVITPLEERRARVDFENPVRAVTSGQAAVFYDGEILIGGGWIERES